MIEYKWKDPSLEDYKGLLEAAGWMPVISATDKSFQAAIENSWQWVTASDQGRLVGMGRLVSDGALYALVCDMIVLPQHQGRGIGTTILNMLQNKCLEHHIQKVWLFAAQGKKDFYRNNGFEPRPDNAPGMEMPR